MGNDSWHVVGPNYPFNKWKYHWCRVLNPAVDAESNKGSLTAFWLPEVQRQREFSAPVLWRICCNTPGTKTLPLPRFKEEKKTFKKKSATKANGAKQDACNCFLCRAKLWEPPRGERRQNASSQNHQASTLQSETQANWGQRKTLLVIRKRDKYRFKRNFRYVVHPQICTLREAVGGRGRGVKKSREITLP